jgi:hypothetical protein
MAGLSALLACHSGFITVPFVSGPFEVRRTATLASDLALLLTVHRSEASPAAAHVIISLPQTIFTGPHLSPDTREQRGLRDAHYSDE